MTVAVWSHRRPACTRDVDGARGAVDHRDVPSGRESSVQECAAVKVCVETEGGMIEIDCEGIRRDVGPASSSKVSISRRLRPASRRSLSKFCSYRRVFSISDSGTQSASGTQSDSGTQDDSGKDQLNTAVLEILGNAALFCAKKVSLILPKAIADGVCRFRNGGRLGHDRAAQLT